MGESPCVQIRPTAFVRPFEWGEEWVRNWPDAPEFHSGNGQRSGSLPDRNEPADDQCVSDDYFAYRTPTDFRLEDGNLLKFTSAVETPYPENNIVHGQWFPPRGWPWGARIIRKEDRCDRAPSLE